MHSSFGFLNTIMSQRDIVRVNQNHSYRKLLARATVEVLVTDTFEPAERENHLLESHNVISCILLMLSSFNHLQVLYLRKNCI